MLIALATPGVATSLNEGFDKIKRLLAEASAQGAAIACFPEAYLPGLRGVDFDVLPFGPSEQERPASRRLGRLQNAAWLLLLSNGVARLGLSGSSATTGCGCTPSTRAWPTIRFREATHAIHPKTSMRPICGRMRTI